MKRSNRANDQAKMERYWQASVPVYLLKSREPRVDYHTDVRASVRAFVRTHGMWSRIDYRVPNFPLMI